MFAPRGFPSLVTPRPRAVVLGEAGERGYLARGGELIPTAAAAGAGADFEGRRLEIGKGRRAGAGKVSEEKMGCGGVARARAWLYSSRDRPGPCWLAHGRASDSARRGQETPRALCAVPCACTTG
jgi:hypothetical protein